MKKEECAKILIESSFKESSLFWVRNSAMSVLQTLLFGFYVNIIADKNMELTPILNYLICSIGIIFSIVHAIILILSQKYNMAWFSAYTEFVDDKLKGKEKNIKYLNIAIKKMSSRKFSLLNTTTIFLLIPISLFIFWVIMILN